MHGHVVIDVGLIKKKHVLSQIAMFHIVCIPFFCYLIVIGDNVLYPNTRGVIKKFITF